MQIQIQLQPVQHTGMSCHVMSCLYSIPVTATGMVKATVEVKVKDTLIVWATIVYSQSHVMSGL